MDLCCHDLDCVSVLEHSNGTINESEKKCGDAEESAVKSTKVGKNKTLKEPSQSTLNAVNKSTSQIKKSSRRNSSPLNWFPRKKMDSYLKRKIQLLQEVGGMNSTLDETLGDSNPHYSRVLREKIAARGAAFKAMEARKAAMVEASWCRVLRAARIHSKEAELLLLQAEKNVEEAFEAAAAMGVIMYDRPDCPRKAFEIESSTITMGGSTTHTVSASLETAFEVDKEVAAAIKSAFICLANCPSSSNKHELGDWLRRVSQNPDTAETNTEMPDCSSGCDSDSSSDSEIRQKKYKNELVDMMFERLKCLQDDELTSLATIVATCGLNAVLLEVENSKHQEVEFGADYSMDPARNYYAEYLKDGHLRKKQVVTELPSLDKFLVKHMSKLEREVQEAKNRRKNESKEGNEENPDKLDTNNATAIPDLGCILVKHTSKLEKEIEEAKKTSGKAYEKENKKQSEHLSDLPSLDKFLVKHMSKLEREVQEAKTREKSADFETRVDNNSKIAYSEAVSDLGSSLIKHSSKLEREIQETKNSTVSDLGKENLNSNKQDDDSSEGASVIRNMSRIERAKLETLEAFSLHNGGTEIESSLDRILVKPVHRLEREKIQAIGMEWDYVTRVDKMKRETDTSDCESLDCILVIKHVSRLEKEKMEHGAKEEMPRVRRDQQLETNTDSLDQIFVKHQSKLEKEKLATVQQPGDDIKHSENRKEARERQLQESWGGLSLENSIRPRLSRLERDKAAWIKAEDEERRARSET
ncbi:hypothetical protein GIB67_030428 [Kingdonia uniflora]|uniref:Uncharacterized protein n=1 Tax=Kingdonia uniflora TaxID=39325 RepID=A0A7J7NDJ8_9MAGN|nr:hypothetical protein GIB67_030428 [Kingdonia uniflora]